MIWRRAGSRGGSIPADSIWSSIVGTTLSVVAACRSVSSSARAPS